AAAPVLHEGRWVPTGAWERLSRQAAVVAGRGDWDQRLDTLAADLDARASADTDPDAPAWRAERDRADAERARALRRFVLGLIDDLTEAAARPRPWPDHARWATRLLARLLGGPHRRDDWPITERKAAERVELALDRLGALGSLEGPVSLEVFTRTLALELESDLGRVGRFGEGVLVGSVGMGVGLDLDLVVVLGLAEGSFPAPPADDTLLPDAEREATAGVLARRAGRVDRQHRELLAVLAGSRRHILGIPRGDLRRNRHRVPSRWALAVGSCLAGRPLQPGELDRPDPAGRRLPWLDHVGSFDAGLRRLAFPATAQEHRLRTLLAGSGGPDHEPADPVLTRGSEVIAARRSPRFTRFDGNLTGLSVPSPVHEVTSATRLERWATCPFSYLVEHILAVHAVDNPEEQLTISSLDRGSLVHEVLERFLAEVLSRPPSAQPSPGTAWSREDRERLAAIGRRCGAHYQERGLTGRAIFWRRDHARILADLQRFLDADERHRRSHATRPVAAELAFGFSWSPLGPVPLALVDGRSVWFRGRADRLDVDAEGRLHVVDYKTGRAEDYLKLCEDDPDLGGTKLQLAVYAAASRGHAGRADAPVRAEYWFVSTRGDFRRAGYDVTPEVLARVGATLSTVVAGIEAGVFPPHPVAASTAPWVACPACDPDGLGTTELRRQWERKRADPGLAAYAELAEPLDELGTGVAGERAGAEPAALTAGG
ncbi:MAG: PD-(D/E)XK nuclease family protein, partial [Actinomycetota bacterium]|nr:PD-(D/E)XK nuclease family protein [Actinomycetota bacterium]